MKKLDRLTLEYIATRIADMEHKHYVQYMQDRVNPHDVDIGKNMAYREIAGIISSAIEHIKEKEKNN